VPQLVEVVRLHLLRILLQNQLSWEMVSGLVGGVVRSVLVTEHGVLLRDLCPVKTENRP